MAFIFIQKRYIRSLKSQEIIGRRSLQQKKMSVITSLKTETVTSIPRVHKKFIATVILLHFIGLPRNTAWQSFFRNFKTLCRQIFLAKLLHLRLREFLPVFENKYVNRTKPESFDLKL